MLSREEIDVIIHVVDEIIDHLRTVPNVTNEVTKRLLVKLNKNNIIKYERIKLKLVDMKSEETN